MNGADWVIVAVVVLSAIVTASEGFFHGAFAMAGLVVGYMVAAWQYKRVAALFAPHLSSPWLGEIAGFLIIFLGVLLLSGVLGRITRWLVREVGLGLFDRGMGALLGAVRGTLVVAIVLVGMTAFAPGAEWVSRSALAPYFLVLGRAAVWVAPSELRARFYQGLGLLRRGQHATPASSNSRGSTN